jgi:hypothetical protein
MRQQMNAIGQTMLLHDQKKLDDHFGGRPDLDLSLPPLLGIVHALESIIKIQAPEKGYTQSFTSPRYTIYNSIATEGSPFNKQYKHLQILQERQRVKSCGFPDSRDGSREWS